MSSSTIVSFILATHNRREVVLETLARVRTCGSEAGSFEIIVVDNASSDSTVDAIAGSVDQLIRLERNLGSCAKSLAVEGATGSFLVFLDDDSLIHPGTVKRMLERFESDPQLGAAGFTVHSADGNLEGTALPNVFHGCGVGFRAEAVREVGGLDASFFMQAEEYDLSFRLVGQGWSVEVFDDLHVDHLKTPCGRQSDRTAFYDVRNNLRLIARYLPPPYYRAYWADWRQRYSWLASKDGHQRAFNRGAAAGWWRSVIERRTYRSRRLKPGALETFFRWGYVGAHMAKMSRQGVARVVFADLGKNVYAFFRAAQQANIEILAIADDHFVESGRTYRDVPVLSVQDSLRLDPDAIVVANTASVFAERTRRKLAQQTAIPVHNWFELPETGEIRTSDAAIRKEPTTAGPRTADNTGIGADIALGACG